MWEGLNTLVVLDTGYSAQGERKIAGFVAAGGIIKNPADATSPLLRETSLSS